MTNRPLPVPDDVSAPFWDACANHILTLPRCRHCREFTMPPDSTCPNCHSLHPQFAFEPVSGRGVVRSWTVIRQSFLQGFDVPFLLVDVQLYEQPKVRMIGRLLNGPNTVLRLGDPVTVAFEDVSSDISVPAFRLERTP